MPGRKNYSPQFKAKVALEASFFLNKLAPGKKNPPKICKNASVNA